MQHVIIYVLSFCVWRQCANSANRQLFPRFSTFCHIIFPEISTNTGRRGREGENGEKKKNVPNAVYIHTHTHTHIYIYIYRSSQLTRSAIYGFHDLLTSAVKPKVVAMIFASPLKTIVTNVSRIL